MDVSTLEQRCYLAAARSARSTPNSRSCSRSRSRRSSLQAMNGAEDLRSWAVSERSDDITGDHLVAGELSFETGRDGERPDRSTPSARSLGRHPAQTSSDPGGAHRTGVVLA